MRDLAERVEQFLNTGFTVGVQRCSILPAEVDTPRYLTSAVAHVVGSSRGHDLGDRVGVDQGAYTVVQLALDRFFPCGEVVAHDATVVVRKLPLELAALANGHGLGVHTRAFEHFGVFVVLAVGTKQIQRLLDAVDHLAAAHQLLSGDEV